MLIEKVKSTLRKYGMVRPGDRVVVAVSGGPDSVCLLCVLNALSTELGISIHAAHLNHMFRELEAVNEAAFVEDLAKRLGIPCTIESYDVPAYCRAKGLSAQAGAREVRYKFLERIAEETGAARIALGHTATDQAETFLMRAIRGAGTSGLAGIPAVREKVIRPLIEVTRQEVLAFLDSQDMGYVIDSSNLKPVYARNRVRLELIPFLSRFNPRLVETLASEASILREDNEVIEAQVSALLPRLMSREAGLVRIDAASFLGLLPGLKRRIFRKAVEAAGLAAKHVSFVQTEDGLRFMESARTGRAMILRHGLVIEREYDFFIFREATVPEPVCVEVSVPGRTDVPQLSITAETAIYEPASMPFKSPFHSAGSDMGRAASDEISEWHAAFDYDKIALPLFIRNRRPGDRFCPSGMGGKHKKLQDFLTDEKVPKRMRDLVPLLTTEKDILWVMGMRTDGRFLPEEGTKRILYIECKREE